LALIEPGQRDRETERLEAVVAGVLRYGVLASLALILAGSIWMFVRGSTGYTRIDAEVRLARGSPSEQQAGSALTIAPTTPIETVRDLFAGKPAALIVLGLLVLIATPVLRVAISVVTYVRQRDLAFALITGYVLGMLILSFALGRSG
jgi:uncharacterized membrane protein